VSATDRIEIRDLRVIGTHGVLPEEQDRPQPFAVDITAWVDMTAAQQSDDLADTVDYGAIAGRIVGLIEGEPVNLIETLAERIAAVCLAEPAVRAAEVTVHKPDAPISVPFDDVTVTIRRRAAAPQDPR